MNVEEKILQLPEESSPNPMPSVFAQKQCCKKNQNSDARSHVILFFFGSKISRYSFFGQQSHVILFFFWSNLTLFCIQQFGASRFIQTTLTGPERKQEYGIRGNGSTNALTNENFKFFIPFLFIIAILLPSKSHIKPYE